MISAKISHPAVRYETSKGLTVFLWGHPGCLDGETTVVKYKRGARGGSRNIKLKNFYAKFNGLPSRSLGKPFDLSLPTYLHSVRSDGTVFYNRVLRVLYSGPRPCVRVSASTGDQLVCTLDHPFLTTEFEYAQACELLGREVLLLGTMRPQQSLDKTRRSKRVAVYTRFHPYGCERVVHAIERMTNPTEYTYRQVQRARLVVEAEMNGASYKDFVHALKHDAASCSQFRYLDPRLEVHHCDENTLNDKRDNLRVLTKEAHARLHGKLRNFNIDGYRAARITDVSCVGQRDTFDITMDPSCPNFAASRFFVHNTWKTAWCAGWPGVVFLSIAAEGGDDTLSRYPRIAQWFMDNNRTKECPPVFNVEKPPKFEVHSTQEFVEYIELICKNKRVWNVCTVVVDGVFALIDMWKREVLTIKSKDKGYKAQKDRLGGDLIDQQTWGFLNLFLSNARVMLQNEGLNVIWTTLQKDVWKEDQRTKESTLVASLPMISGQNKTTLPAMCKLHINARLEKQPRVDLPGVYQVVPRYTTAPMREMDLRHKYFMAFPQGCLVDPDFGTLPTFRAVYYELSEFIYTGQ